MASHLRLVGRAAAWLLPCSLVSLLPAAAYATEVAIGFGVKEGNTAWILAAGKTSAYVTEFAKKKCAANGIPGCKLIRSDDYKPCVALTGIGHLRFYPGSGTTLVEAEENALSWCGKEQGVGACTLYAAICRDNSYGQLERLANDSPTVHYHVVNLGGQRLNCPKCSSHQAQYRYLDRSKSFEFQVKPMTYHELGTCY